MGYVHWCVYMDPSLRSWDKTNLIMANDLFDVQSNFIFDVQQNFILLKSFTSMFIEEFDL